MTVEYAHDKRCDIFCDCPAPPMYGISRYILLFQAIEMLMCFDYLGSVLFRNEAQRLRHWRTQVAHGVYGLQPRNVLQ